MLDCRPASGALNVEIDERSPLIAHVANRTVNFEPRDISRLISAYLCTLAPGVSRRDLNQPEN